MVSDAVVDIVRGVTTKPSFFIAKGGITSHDIAVKSFDIRTARVLGQVDPGVPGRCLPTPPIYLQTSSSPTYLCTTLPPPPFLSNPPPF